MKFLLDVNVSQDIYKMLKEYKTYKVRHSNKKFRNFDDKEIVKEAISSKECIITYDMDYENFIYLEHYGIIRMIGSQKNSLINLKKFLATDFFKNKSQSFNNYFVRINDLYYEVLTPKYTKRGKRTRPHVARYNFQ